jgi:hypothetical protein
MPTHPAPPTRTRLIQVWGVILFLPALFVFVYGWLRCFGSADSGAVIMLLFSLLYVTFVWLICRLFR